MDTSLYAYRLLTLIALSGEVSTDIILHLGMSKSYGEKLITRLKNENYIKTHYKDRLRGYRLTRKGKNLLLKENPKRFSFYLSGNTDTNRPRSDYARRLRLQNASIVYSMLQNSDVTIFRDEKPELFQSAKLDKALLPLPVFYHSRELKELGAEAVKINNSRSIGILLAPECIYVLFYTGESLLKWEYRTELRVKALMNHHITSGVLSRESISPSYHPDTPIKALFIGKDMDTALKLLTSTGGFQRSYFCLDSSFDCFHYIPDTLAGETVIRLLCQPVLQDKLRELLLSDLQPPDTDYGFDHDATSDGTPVLLAYDFDMLRISRYYTALSLHGLAGNLICFDFQKEVLSEYFGRMVQIETIDLQKFERRFLT